MFMSLCLCAHASRYHKVIGSPAPGGTGGCEPPDMGWWELNSGPLEEQQALVTTEHSLQS